MHSEPPTLRATRILLSAVLLCALAACGPKPAPQHPEVEVIPDEPAVVLDEEPEILIVEPDGSTTTWTPATLFQRAKQEFRDGDHATAASHFELVAESTEVGGGYVLPSLFNAGASYEHLGDYDAAIAAYNRMVELAPESEDGVDAALRLAEIYAQQGLWHEVRDAMRALVALERIKVAPRTQGYYRLGFAEIALGRLDDAEATFTAGLITNRSAGRGTLPDNSYFVAGSEYGLALVEHMRFSRVKLRQPPEVMRRGYRDKKRLSKEAFNQYNRVIVFGNSYWGILSAYQIGKLFEDYYYDLLSAEIPEGVEGDELRAYFEDWREELRPFLDEAIKMYEATYELSQGTPQEDNPWVTASYERLQHLRAYLDDEDAHAREEALILKLSERMRGGPELMPSPELSLPTPRAATPH